MTGRAPSAGQQGFSLAEMLVVLALLAMAAAIAGPALRQGGARDLERAARDIAALARSARMDAIGGNREAVLVFERDRRRFRAEGARPVSVDPDVEVAITTAATEAREETARIRFFADGTSTGGLVTLTAEGRTRIVRIEWLTGAVRTLDPEAAP